ELIHALQFTADSSNLIAVVRGGQMAPGQIHTWNIATGKAGTVWKNDPTMGELIAAAASPDGKTLAAMNKTGVIRIWEMVAGKEIRPLPVGSSAIDTLSFSADDKSILTVCKEHAVRRWDADTGRPLGTPLGLPNGLFPRFWDDGKILAVMDVQ